MPRRLVLAVLLAVVVLGALLVSAAVYTDTTATDGLSLEVGTVDVATAPVTLDLVAAALVPGDVVATPLVVRNDGSLELRYSLSTSVDDADLATLLELTVRTGVTSCDATGADADGTLLVGPVPLGAPTTTPVLGDPAPGAQPGDRVLAPGSEDVLCLRVELPPTTTEAEAAGRSLTASLRVDAEQTAANP